MDGQPCSATIRHMILLLFISTVFAQQTSAGTLRFTAPPEWTVREPASSMRVAEFTLPRSPADREDGELVVYFFGGSGGSVDANLERWIGQMQQPDGRPSKDRARRTERQVNGLGVTMLDVSGTYVAEVRPGSTERHNKPRFSMRAAVVTTPKGPYFVKAVGPAETMGRWNDAFEKFIASLRFEH